MVKEKACAKINLFLDVLGKRPDQYHDLEMVMAPIKLCDYLTFKKNKNGDINIKTNVEVTDSLQNNLIYKAIKRLEEKSGKVLGVDVVLEKHIPIAGGLAGGSADAAATLRGINKLYKLKYTNEQLAELGEDIGADVPYCIYNKLCIARGKGEKLFFLNHKINHEILLINPGIKVSTKEVFDQIDMKKITPRKITAMTNAIYNKNTELMISELYNALEPFTFELFDEVKKCKDEILSYNPKGVLMSGSGPTFFVCGLDRKDLLIMKEGLEKKYHVYHTKIH